MFTGETMWTDVLGGPLLLARPGLAATESVEAFTTQDFPCKGGAGTN